MIEGRLRVVKPKKLTQILFFRFISNSQTSRLVSITTQTITRLKGQRPIVAVTAYDAPMAGYADAAGVDLILVGDSVGTTQLGFESTVPVTLDMMVHHTAAVARAKPKALLVADVPFAIAHDDFTVLLEACRRLMQEGGAEAIKIEGDATMAPTLERLTRAGIPVLGHIGLLPQNFHQLGGYRKFGRKKSEQAQLVADALAFEAANCFAVLCEMTDAIATAAITAALKVPLIGIGSGVDCDGQILVSNDLLGLNAGYVPTFVKQYAKLGEAARNAFAAYADEVRNRKFPS